MWRSMKERCSNPQDKSFPNYGGRGIKVCDHWLNFAAYAADIAALGPKPSPKHSLDRINNDGDYEPGNMKWSTRSEQALNRRPLRFNGQYSTSPSAIQSREYIAKQTPEWRVMRRTLARRHWRYPQTGGLTWARTSSGFEYWSY